MLQACVKISPGRMVPSWDTATAKALRVAVCFLLYMSHSHSPIRQECTGFSSIFSAALTLAASLLNYYFLTPNWTVDPSRGVSLGLFHSSGLSGAWLKLMCAFFFAAKHTASYSLALLCHMLQKKTKPSQIYPDAFPSPAPDRSSFCMQVSFGELHFPIREPASPQAI